MTGDSTGKENYPLQSAQKSSDCEFDFTSHRFLELLRCTMNKPEAIFVSGFNLGHT
jgi:hypothetical protein